jgi:diacylglycerol kinase family enzyme
MVNDRIFLVNASVGLYPQVLEDRETWKAQYGRSRFVALLAGIATIVRQHHQLRITLEFKDHTRTVRTPTLFVGNNALQMQQIGMPPLAEALENGCLAGIMLRPVGTWSMLWLLVRGMLGRLGEADSVVSFTLRSMTVLPSRLARTRRYKVATDGEVDWMAPPLHFRVAPRPLRLLKRDAPDTPEAAA